MTRAQLKTARLTLRPARPDDAAAVIAAANDLGISRWLTRIPHPYGPADFQHFLQNIAVAGETFIIEDSAGFAGVIGVQGELGYWLTLRAMGRGYATEAARAVLSSRFLDDPSPINAGYFADNTRSAQVLKKLGFVQTGQDVKQSMATGKVGARVKVGLDFAAFQAALPVYNSARLTYRDLMPHDAPALHSIVSQWDVVRQLGSFPWPADPVFTETRCAPYSGAGFSWGIFLAGKMIGTLAITNGELGYMIDPAQHRRGYAREAIVFGMAQAALPQIEAEVWDDNLPSLTLLMGLGFRPAYPTQHHAKARGIPMGGLRLIRAHPPA